MKIALAPLMFLISLHTHLVLGNDCLETRAAFDIGAQNTKIKVARVDTCLQQIKEVLYEDSAEINLVGSSMKNFGKTLRVAQLHHAVSTIKLLKERSTAFSPVSFRALVSPVIKENSNGSLMLKMISKRVEVPIQIASPELEGKILFAAATSLTSIEAPDMAIWDIGAYDMRFVSYAGNNDFTILTNHWGASRFKKLVSEVIQEKSGKISPNPVFKSDARQAARELKDFIKDKLADEFEDKIGKTDKKIYALGGVHHQFLGLAMGLGNRFTRSDVQGKLKKYLNSTDEQLSQFRFPQHVVTNLILVEAFMDSLGIEEVHTLSVNMADGILVMPAVIDWDRPLYL